MKRHKFKKVKRINKERWMAYGSLAIILGLGVIAGFQGVGNDVSKDQILKIEQAKEENEKPEISEGETASGEDLKEAVDLTGDAEGYAYDFSIKNAKDVANDIKEMTDEVAKLDEESREDEENGVEEEAAVETLADKSYKNEQLHFDVASGLSWPVLGNIVMNYSVDERIYYATMNQYVYYPAIAISSAVNAPVQSAATGCVKEISVDEEIGQYVVMDLGDGYKVTYGQLSNISVEEGDVVKAGDIFATIAEPTKYYAVEGVNLYLKLEKDKESLNPLVYLK